MALATHEDVEARYIGEPLEPEVLAVVDVRLGDAELILKNKIPTLLTQATDSEDYHDTVVMIEAEMVLRLIRNPEGYSQESDGNYSYAIYQAVASGKLEVLDDEWDLLGLGKGMFVITPYLAPAIGPEGAFDPTNYYPPWYWDFPGPVGPWGPTPT